MLVGQLQLLHPCRHCLQVLCNPRLNAVHVLTLSLDLPAITAAAAQTATEDDATSATNDKIMPWAVYHSVQLLM